MIWNRDNEQKLKTYWLAGLSGGQIALKLNTTRSAILGKARRMNLPSRDDGRRPVKVPKEKTKHSHTSLMNAVMNLRENLCHYPIGHVDKPDFKFCLEPVVNRGRYCAEHKKLCFEPKKTR